MTNEALATAQLKLRPFKATQDRVFPQATQPDAKQDIEAQAH